MGGKLSKKKKGYNVNDEKAKDKDKKAEGAATEEEGTPKRAETKSDGAPASDSKPGSSEAAPSSKETPAATEAPSSTPKAQAPAASAEEPKPVEAPAANSDQTVAVKE
uniref:Brain acid soluble protein 1 n=1 Tax=Macaca fascicularis TaxID=9541 RepID=A0A7N9CXH8_MACFA